MAAKHAMEIFSALNKSNCRECGEKTCLAFAGAVFTGRKSIAACPYLASEDRIRLAGEEPRAAVPVDSGEENLDQLIVRLQHLDFEEAAARCGGYLKNGRLCLKVMGKEFRIDQHGRLGSDIHVNSWLTMPLLTYVVHGRGHLPRGRWISYREVEGGRERYGLFQKRCEDDLRKIADAWPDLFKDMVEMFQGEKVASQFASDISVVLLPLPRVPVMICYWLPEEGIDSTLNIFFDVTVNDNLGNDGIYTLCAGLTTMFAKLALRHGFMA